MAVKTSFSKVDFLKILSEYDLGELESYEPITKGAVQTNFILNTTKGKFIFRYYENRSEGSVSFETELIKFLNSKNYPCPKIFSDKNGKYVGSFNEKPFAIFEFVEGEHLENPTEEQKNQLIEKVALLQNITRDFEPKYKEYRWNYSKKLCLELAEKEVQKIDTENAKQKLEWYKTELAKIELPESLPKGICHCDFYFSNILFKEGEFKALIDFDDANYTYLTFDLASIINPFISGFEWNTWERFTLDDNVFDFAESKKIVVEYQKYRQLSEEEKKYFFDVIKLVIMLDCIWRFERGEASDFFERRKIEYLNKLGREKLYERLFEK